MGYEEIKETVFKYFSGKTDLNQESEILNYLSSKPDGREILEDMEKEWLVQNGRNQSVRMSFHILMERIRRRKRRRIFAAVAASAASLAAVAVFSHYLISNYSVAESYAFCTEAGEKVCITLPDSSKVWLNSGSELHYSEMVLSGKRKVELKGEAFFDVRKHAGRSFVVYAGDASVAVTGTEFNVKLCPEGDVQTALVSGSVKFDAGAETVAMVPGDLLTYDSADRSISKSNTDLSRYVDWVEMRLDYPEISVARLFSRLEMIYGVEIDYRQEKYGNRIFRIILSDKDSIEDVLDAVSVMIPIKYERNCNIITVKEI